MNSAWLRRRWFEFRAGHSMYLTFALTFVNFILIVYRLLVEEVPLLSSLFPHLWVFALLFVIIYPPLAVAIGHWHRKSQLPTEANIGFLASPLFAKLYRIQLQVMQGTASKEEVDEMTNLLRQVEKAGR